jgi:multisubunit Na+/H+ antiporter MnhB subunit
VTSLNLSRVGVLVGTVVFLLFCLGFGWGPASASRGPEQVALVGLAAAGLLWPVLVFGLVGRARRTEGTGTAAE